MIPKLLHPVPCVIEKIDRAGTIMDEDAREPIQSASRPTTVTVPGQVEWGTQMGLEAAKTGPRETSSGYVLFRRIDLEAAGVTLEDNDRLAKLGDVETDVYINRLEWKGHYPDQGGPTMVKAYFADRAPSKQTRGEI